VPEGEPERIIMFFFFFPKKKIMEYGTDGGRNTDGLGSVKKEFNVHIVKSSRDVKEHIDDFTFVDESIPYVCR
jgi:hypothetical protein